MVSTPRVHSGTITIAVASQLVEKQQSHSPYTVNCGCRDFSRMSEDAVSGRSYELKITVPRSLQVFPVLTHSSSPLLKQSGSACDEYQLLCLCRAKVTGDKGR